MDDQVHQTAGLALRGDRALKTALASMIAPYYLDANALLEREIAGCSDCWIGLAGGLPHAFFLVRRERDQVYLGLSGTSSQARRSGLAHRLYSAFVDTGRRWEAESGTRLLLWGTTATPVAVRAVRTVFADAIPDENATIPPALRDSIDELRRRLGAPATEEHPLVIRGIAVDTRYTPQEAERNRKYAKEHGILILESLGVNEERGDRMLFLCRVPP